MSQEEDLKELAKLLSMGEITANEYKSRVEELVSAARVDALERAETDSEEPSSSVAQDRIKSAAKKARSYN